MTEVLWIADEAEYPREYRKPTLRTLKHEAYYRDVNNEWNSGSPELVEDTEAVQKQIANLLGTPKGTEHYEPMYGSDLPYRIMDFIDPLRAYLVETDVFYAIWLHMRDRVQIDYTRSRVTPLETEDGYLVDLTYMILRTSTLVTYKFEVVR